MSRRTILTGGDVVLYEGVMHNGTVVLDGGVIEIVCLGPEYEPSPGDTTINCAGRFVCPGFIDLHNQGGNGYSVLDGTEESVEGLCRAHAAHGTTGLLLTPPIQRESYATLLPMFAGFVGRDTGGAAVLGIHAEGPFLNPGKRGCMPESGVSEPDFGYFESILEAGGGAIREMTIAPELPGSPDIIHRCATAGVVPSLGHSNATLTDVLRAVDHGARHVTHFFNAMSPLHHREPGLTGAALFSPELTVELVADGFHVHPWVMGLTIQNKRIDRTCLVTDAMSVMGLPEGEHESLGLSVTLKNDRLSLTDDPGVLAGSVLSMDHAVANMVTMVGLSISEAVTMASATPAAVIGLDGRKGMLAEGFDADIAVLDQRYGTVKTIVGGRVVFDADGKPRS